MSINETLQEEFVSILVPKALVVGVYRWIGEQSGTKLQEVTPVSTQTDKGAASLLPLAVKKLVDESPPAMKQLLAAIAKRCPNEISTKELASTLNREGADSLTVAGTLGAYGRRFKNRHPGEEPPFKSRWDHGAGSQKYSMSPEMAKEILSHLLSGGFGSISPPSKDRHG